MKKAVFLNNERKKIIQFSKICFFLFLFTGCGLEEFPYLNAPVQPFRTRLYSDSAPEEQYFSFLTQENENPGINLLGTEVYYKIYNNISTLNSVQNSINSLNSSTNSTSAAAALKDTYSYKPLKLSNGNITPLIKKEGSNNKYVYIRLTDKNNESLKSAICVDSVPISLFENGKTPQLQYEGEPVYPRRYIDSKLTFNFGCDNVESDKIPNKDDEDVKWSDTFTEEHKWYVDMYAVTVGINTSTWTEYYSEVLPLGSVTIVEGENN